MRASSLVAIVGALAVIIALAAAPSGPFTVTSGALLGVKGLVAAVAVGFAGPMWAFGAGLGLGVVEVAIASGEIGRQGVGPAWREVLPITAALMLLAWRSLRREPEAE